MILENTLTRTQAMKLREQNNRVAKAVIYLKQLDKRMIYRLGKADDPRITRLRYNEDDRPQTSINRRTGVSVAKRNEIITYGEKDELYVLGKSGGVSLFDAMSSKLTLGNRDCWYYVPKDVRIPEGIVIAKDVSPDAHGDFHYAFQPECDMKLTEFKAKLAEIGKQMRRV